MSNTSIQYIPRLLIGALLVGLAVFAPAVRSVAERQQEAAPLVTGPELQQRNSNAFAMILGEFRASMADFMFIKTERYLDSGIAYAPHIHVEQMPSQNNDLNAESLSVKTAASSSPAVVHADHDADHGEDHDEEEHHHHPATIIRTAANDFRGFLGNLEREVKPYRDPSLPHHHTSGEELLPWYRLVTLANPHQVRAYLIGAMWLTQQNQRPQAIAFLQEGIRNNAGNDQLFRLYVSLATTYVGSRFVNPQDLSWQPLALDAAKNAFQFGLAARKKAVGGGPLLKPTDRWSQDDEDDLQIGAHYVALLEQALGRNAEALQSALELQKFSPNFGPNQRLLNELQSQPR